MTHRGWLIMMIIGLLLGWPAGTPQAATVNAASCTVAAVQAAHTAANPGDTIQMPTCTATGWDSTVTITKANITLKGTGQATTVIQRAAVNAQWDANPMFQVNNSATNFVAQDFTLNGTQDTDPENCDVAGGWVDVGIRLNTAVDFRIHHIHFDWLEVGVIAEGNPLTQRGVVDHNTFTDIHGVDGHDCWGYALIVDGSGTFPALDLGTSQNVFLEDNTGLRMKGFVATNNGARAVARHNTADEVGVPNSCVNTHGLGAFIHGSRQIEVYDNVCNLAGGGQWGIDISGGDAVVFNNQIDTGYNSDIVVWNDGNCGGSYPQPDQPREVYVWNNITIPGGAAAVTVNNGCAVVQLDRDYFLSPRPGYTPYTYPHPATVTTTAPTAPTSFAVSSPTVSTASATWVASTDVDGDLAGYRVYSCAPSGSCTRTALMEFSPGTSGTIRGLFGGLTNSLAIRAFDAAGNESGDSNVVTTTTSAIPAGSPELQINFEVGSGSAVFDSSGHGHNSSVHTGLFSALIPSGGGSFSGNYTGALSTRIPRTTALESTAVTLMAWVRRAGAQGAFTSIARKSWQSAGPPTYVSYDLIINPGGTGTDLIGCEIGSTGTNTTIISAANALPDVTWTHVACTYDPAGGAPQHKLYVNGVLSGTAGTMTVPILYDATATGDFWIAQNGGGGQFLTGFVDEVRIYPLALTQAQIQTAAGLTDLVAPAAPTNLRVVSP